VTKDLPYLGVQPVLHTRLHRGDWTQLAELLMDCISPVRHACPQRLNLRTVLLPLLQVSHKSTAQLTENLGMNFHSTEIGGPNAALDT